MLPGVEPILAALRVELVLRRRLDEAQRHVHERLVRASAVSDVTAESIDCFSDLVDSWSKHRYWRRALETAFVCKRSGRLMSVVNLHVISGSEDNTVKSSVVPGTTPQERERFKSMALQNTLVQAHYRLGARVDQSTERLPGVFIVAGDMNLDTAAVRACLSEVASETNQTLVGMSSFGGVCRVVLVVLDLGFVVVVC